jgi:hypothetical protein
VRCRFCQQEGIHYCPGGKLQSGDREFDLYGETRAFPGLADAAEHFSLPDDTERLDSARSLS